MKIIALFLNYDGGPIWVYEDEEVKKSFLNYLSFLVKGLSYMAEDFRELSDI